MVNKIKRVEIFTSCGDNSDSGIIYINSIHAYNENDEELLLNDYINFYNQGSEIKFYQENDDISYKEICNDIAKNLSISVNQIFCKFE